MAKGIIDASGNEIQFEPPVPTEETRGGILAKSVEDTDEMAEVVIGTDGKAYVDALFVNVRGEF